MGDGILSIIENGRLTIKMTLFDVVQLFLDCLIYVSFRDCSFPQLMVSTWSLPCIPFVGKGHGVANNTQLPLDAVIGLNVTQH